MGLITQPLLEVRNTLLRESPHIAFGLLRCLTGLQRHFPSVARDELADNLTLAFPSYSACEIDRLVQKTLVTQLVEGAAQFRLELLPRKRLQHEVRAMKVVGAYHLEQARATGRAIILVTPHYGAFMHAALWIASESFGEPVHFFYNPTERNPYADTSDQLIDRVCNRVVKVRNDRRGVIAVMRALKKGAMLCIMPDQIAPLGETAYVPFFGRFFAVMRGTAFLAMKTNSLILPIFCYDRECSGLTFEYKPALPAEPETDEQTSVYRITAALFREFEVQFRSAPEHWRYWNQFSRRSLAAPLPPRSHIELLSQITDLSRRFGADTSLANVAMRWRCKLESMASHEWPAASQSDCEICPGLHGT